jgi:hypothetical protein
MVIAARSSVVGKNEIGLLRDELLGREKLTTAA